MNAYLSALLSSLITLAVCGALHGASPPPSPPPPPSDYEADSNALLQMLRDVGIMNALKSAGQAQKRWQESYPAQLPHRQFQEWMAWLYRTAFNTGLLPAKFNGHMNDRPPECGDKELRAAMPVHLLPSSCQSLGRISQETFLEEQIARLRSTIKLPCLHGKGVNKTSCSCVEWDGRYLPMLVKRGICDDATSYKLVYAKPDRQRVEVSTRRILGDIQKGDAFIPSTLKFDIVWCTSVFEHLPYPHVAMKQLARITKPGGFISWSAPFFAKYHSDPFDFWRLSHDALYLMSRDAGLQVSGLYGVGNRLVTTASLAGIGLDQLKGERATKITRMGKAPFLQETNPTATPWYMAVFADVRKPLTAPTGIDYESRAWLYSSDAELHSDTAPSGLSFPHKAKSGASGRGRGNRGGRGKGRGRRSSK